MDQRFVNQISGVVAYSAQIWNPATGHWTTGDSAVKPRLYHSIALLLPDGSVLTGAGGAPGPVKNLNAKYYYPPYLYDGMAIRRLVRSLPRSRVPYVSEGHYNLRVGPNDTISRVTLLRTGSVTHAFDPSARFFNVPARRAVNGQNVSVTLPGNENVLLPGYYMVFAFNGAGVPSIAKTIRVLQ